MAIAVAATDVIPSDHGPREGKSSGAAAGDHHGSSRESVESIEDTGNLWNPWNCRNFMESMENVQNLWNPWNLPEIYGIHGSCREHMERMQDKQVIVCGGLLHPLLDHSPSGFWHALRETNSVGALRSPAS